MKLKQKKWVHRWGYSYRWANNYYSQLIRLKYKRSNYEEAVDEHFEPQFYITVPWWGNNQQIGWKTQRIFTEKMKANDRAMEEVSMLRSIWKPKQICEDWLKHLVILLKTYFEKYLFFPFLLYFVVIFIRATT